VKKCVKKYMKKYLVFVTLLTIIMPLFGAKKDHASEILMFPRPVYYFVEATKNRWSEQITHKQGDRKIAFLITPMFQETRCDECAASYFLLNCKSKISIKSDPALPTDPLPFRDVRSEWLGITDSDFDATFTVAPWQRQAGVVLAYNQDLGSLTSFNFLKYWWLDVSLPILQVQNNLNAQSSSQKVTDALKRNDLNVAKMDNLCRKKTGIGELLVTLGTTVINWDCFTLSYYGGLASAGETRRNEEYLFKPSTGSAGHFAIINGLLCRLPFYECQDNRDSVDFFCSMELRYRMRRNEERVFDLCANPWSRYLLVHRRNDPRTIPAANVLTHCIEVRPGCAFDLATGVSADHNGFGFEVGYNLWATQTEYLKVINPPFCDKATPLMESYGIMGSDATKTASRSTIAYRADDDDVFIPLRRTQLDFNSAAVQGTASNRLFASIFIQGTKKDYDILCAIGGWADWPHNNATLKTYGLWGNISFGW